MPKHYFSSALILCLISLFSHAENFGSKPAEIYMPFSVTTSLEGFTTIYYSGYVSNFTDTWDVEYGQVGFATGTGILITSINSLYKSIIINQFLQYDFRIRRRSWNGPHEWSQTQTINLCMNTVNLVGYNYDFNEDLEYSCWKGYENPLQSYNASNISIEKDAENNRTGQGFAIVLRDSNEYGGDGAVFVSPKISDLSTDKKIKFWVKNYTNNGLRVGTLTDPHDFSTFHLLSNVASENSPDNYLEKSVYFDNYNGTDQYIAFVYNKSFTANDYIYIDDFSYEQSVNCFNILSTNISDIQQNEVQLNISAPTQSSWEISLTNGILNTTETRIATTNPFILTGLAGNTNYKVKVRGICEPGHFSNSSAEIQFLTSCNTISEGFETSFGETEYVDQCWTILTNDSYVRQVSSDFSGTNVNILPRSGSKMIDIRSSSFSNVSKLIFSTPYVTDIDSNKRISFYLVAKGASNYNNDSLTIGTMSDPNDESTFVANRVISPLEMNEVFGFETNAYWKQHIVYFDNYNTALNHHYIAFKHSDLHAGVSFYLDDFKYENKPVCTEVTNLKTLDVTSDSATVTCETYQNSTASNYEIQYGVSGFVLGSGITVSTETFPVTISNGLSSDTIYDFYVRSNCGNWSEWSDRGTFKTKCSASLVGYTHGFEGITFETNSCWIRSVPKIRNNYYSKNSFIKLQDGGHSGSKSVYVLNETNAFNADPQATAKTILISPELQDFDNYKKVSFWMKTSAAITVVVGTIADPDEYATFESFNEISVTTPNVWIQYEVDFSGYYGNNNFVGFKHLAGNPRQSFSMDDFVYIGESCPRPTLLTAAQSGTNSELLGWQNNDVANLSASWEIEYGLTGFIDGTGLIATSLQNTFDLGGLNPTSKYEFRVRSKCNATTFSNWSDRYAFKISCFETAPYAENFDNVDLNTQYIDTDICWTMPDQNTGRYDLFDFLDGVNSEPNVISLRRHSNFNDEYEIPGMIISPYLADFNNTKRIKVWVNNWSNMFPGHQHYENALVVGMLSNPLDKSTFVPFTTLDLSEVPFYGKQFTVDFTTYTGNAKHIAFLFEGEPGAGFIYLDDFLYSEITDCREPLNAAATAVNTNSAQLIWDQTETPDVQIEYGLQGFAVGSGTTINLSSQSGYLLSGLQSATAYEFYIKSNCGSESSINVGPYLFTTTCSVTAIPWLEDFNSLPEYGLNLLPDCFRITDGNWITANQPIVIDPISCTFTGINDTTYLTMPSSFSASLITPMFNLIAGTTYTFKAMAMKDYQYATRGLVAYAGMGNTFQSMKNALDGSGTIQSAYQMETVFYHFTPVISGDYSFYMQYLTSGGSRIAIDNFELKEGYSNVVNAGSGTITYDFTTQNPDLIIETTRNCTNEITEDPTDNTNKTVSMTGANSLTDWNSFGNVWENNQNSITKINLKVSSSTPELYLSFDLKQTFSSNSSASLFRVLVNGVVVGNTISASSPSSDGFINHQFNLTPFLGSDLRISLQHIGRSDGFTMDGRSALEQGIGDTAFVDDLVLSPNQVLANHLFEKHDFKLFPNPVNDILNIISDDVIATVAIYNLNGQLLSTANFNEKNVTLSIANYPSGVYFVKVSSQNNSTTMKVVKR